jgi:hypothetical protein
VLLRGLRLVTIYGHVTECGYSARHLEGKNERILGDLRLLCQRCHIYLFKEDGGTPTGDFYPPR